MRSLGTVTAVFAQRGFAWAEPDNVRAAVFVHFNDVRRKIPLKVGDRINFEMAESPKGFKGVDVVLLNEGRAR